MSPSVNRSGARSWNETSSGISHEGRDLIWDRSMRIPPVGRWEGWRVAVREQVRGQVVE